MQKLLQHILQQNGQAVAKDGNVTVAAKASGKQEVTVENVVIKSQKDDEWNKLDTELPFKAPADTVQILRLL